jgi:hypothetical protein
MTKNGSSLSSSKDEGLDPKKETINSLAVLVDRAIQIRPLARDLHIGLIDQPRRIGVAPIPADALFHERRVVLNPAKKRRVIDHHAALAHHFFKVSVAVPKLA